MLTKFVRKAKDSVPWMVVFVIVVGIPVALATIIWPPFCKKWDSFVDSALGD